MYYSILIISIITNILENILSYHLKDGNDHKINRTLLTQGLYDNFLMKIIYDDAHKKKYWTRASAPITKKKMINFKSVQIFCCSYVNFYKIYTDKHNPRKCIHPIKKWSTKQNLAIRHEKEKQIIKEKQQFAIKKIAEKEKVEDLTDVTDNKNLNDNNNNVITKQTIKVKKRHTKQKIVCDSDNIEIKSPKVRRKKTQKE